MARREFEMIVASAVKKGFRFEDLTTQSKVLVGAKETIDVYTIDGTMAYLKTLYVDVPAVSDTATGTHSITVTDNLAPSGGYILGQYPATEDIHFEKMSWDNVGQATKLLPSDSGGVISSLNNAIFDSEFALRINYYNASNVDTVSSQLRRVGIKYILEDTPKF